LAGLIVNQFGWIDSKPNKLDEMRSLLWFAPRKSGTGWSKLNQERVERAIANSLMAHSLGYHIIWCPKYCHQVLQDAFEVELKRILAETCAHYGWKLHELESMPDHVHIFVQADHTTAPVEIAKTLKSISAVHIFNKFPTLKGRKFWGSGLWSRGTYDASVIYPQWCWHSGWNRRCDRSLVQAYFDGCGRAERAHTHQNSYLPQLTLE
jgi:putative transposase